MNEVIVALQSAIIVLFWISLVGGVVGVAELLQLLDSVVESFVLFVQLCLGEKWRSAELPATSGPIAIKPWRGEGECDQEVEETNQY